MTDNEREINANIPDKDDEYEELLFAAENIEESIIPELYFRNPDPYMKHEPLSDDHPRRHYRFDDEGRIVAKNLSAYWIPEIKLVEEIDGTIYTVTGSYKGTERLDQKLTRIMMHNLENME